MKKRIAIGIGVFVLLILAICLLFGPSEERNPYQAQQDRLAAEFGIRVTDYPYVRSFPAGYFYTLLKPGMSVDEVHKVLRGYEKVFRCGSPVDPYYSREVYYYFSSDDSKALRFQIFYDKQEKYENIQGEDSNSRSIPVDNCEEGLIEKIKR
jgi:hypothetical protein